MLLNLILAILASYRLTVLITNDNGPFGIFHKFRYWTDVKASEGKLTGLNEAIYCAYCTGIYTSFVCALFVAKDLYSIILYTFAIAGGQVIIHKLLDEKAEA